MKKKYISPETQITFLSMESHLLTESNTGGDMKSLSVDRNQTVGAGLVKDNSSYNVWDDDWSN